jgi:nitroreductase
MAVCPNGALSILGVDPKQAVAVSKSNWPSAESVSAFVRTRRSTRQFLPENVSPKIIKSILDDLQFAPTARNQRLLEYSVVDDISAMDTLRESLISLSEKAIENGLQSPFVKGVVKYYRQGKVDILFRGAPHIIVVSAQKSQVGGLVDVSLALAYFEFLANSLGLGTCWCGFLSVAVAAVPGLRSLLGVGEENQFYTMNFGLPAVEYSRSIQREGTAKIRYLKNEELKIQ